MTPKPTAPSIEELIKESMEEARLFFDDQGIKIQRLPTYQVIDEFYGASQKVAFLYANRLRVGHVLLAEQLRTSAKERGNDRFRDYDLTFSDAALEEFREYSIPRLMNWLSLGEETIKHFDSYGKDLIFFRPFAEIVRNDDDYLILDSICVQALWGTYEVEQGIMPSIATMAASSFCVASYVRTMADISIDELISSYDEGIQELRGSPELSLFDYSASILELEGGRIAARYADSLNALINSDVRKQIKTDMQACIKSTIGHVASSRHEMVEKFNRQVYPEFSVLDKGLTHDNLILAFRNMGLDIFASELEAQNTGRLLDALKNSGYGPTSA